MVPAGTVYTAPPASWIEAVALTRPSRSCPAPPLMLASIAILAGWPGSGRPGRGGMIRRHSWRAGSGDRSGRSSTVRAP